jgi:PAS domain S-box-containing protein
MYEENTKKILIIDDDPLVLKSFLSLLNSDGYSAIGVSNLSKALKLLEQDIFDIILTELVMEERCGNELLSAIFQKTPGTTVIVLTGYRSFQLAIDAIRAGAYDYIIKPCDYHMLKTKIDNAITAMKIMEEEKRTEKALKTSEERYRIVIENIHDLLLLFDKDKNCLYASPSWENQFGQSMKRLAGKKWLDLFSLEDKKKIERAFHSLVKNKQQSQELEINLYESHGEKRTFKGYMLSPKNGITQEPLMFLLFHDITEHLKVQIQEKEIERIKAAKNLAIATAHHINQPMTCIRGLTEIMLKEPKGRNVSLEYLEQIVIQCDIVQDIIERLQNINTYETEPYVDEEMLKLFNQ